MKFLCNIFRLSVVSILFFCLLPASGFSQFKLVEDPENGLLTLLEGENKVLIYRFGDQLKEGLDVKYKRSSFIHPLYSLDGEVLTDAFPGDHAHHYGVFWTWPVVRTRGQDTQTWHPSNLRQYFVRWLERRTDARGASIKVQNAWKLEGGEIVADEILTFFIHPVDNVSRAIDVELKIRAVGGRLELAGSPEGNKGYGGLCIRGAPMFTGASLTTDKGPLEKDSVNVPFSWGDMSTSDVGIAIFVSSDHPGFPITWLIRNSYSGVLNASWPGLEPVGLKADETVTLRYRIYIHRGDVSKGKVFEAYKSYLAERLH
ncbi:DUF6807 family protein [Acidobacteriota bacterium]